MAQVTEVHIVKKISRVDMHDESQINSSGQESGWISRIPIFLNSVSSG